MKNSIPLQEWVPAGPLRDMSSQYLEQLPDVQAHPLGPQSLVEPSDHAWSEYVVAYALLYPWVVLLLGLMGGAGMWAMFKVSQRRELRHLVACRRCGGRMYPCGLHCPHCRERNPFPRALNWIGYSRMGKIIPASGRIMQEQSLRSYRRCFYCGEPLAVPSLHQQCPACHYDVLQGRAAMKAYDGYIARRRYWTYAAVVVLGVIPVLGPLLASSLYKRTLINPYGLYMTVFRESFLMVLLMVCRHLFRLLPFIGIVGMPVLCWTEYHVYRRMFLWKAGGGGES